MKNLLLSLATVCIALYCTHLLGEAETVDVQKATKENGNNLEQASDADNEVNSVFEEAMESELEELGVSEEMKSRLTQRLREAPENLPMDTEKGGEETAAESDANNDALEPFERAKEDIAKIVKQYREDVKEHLRKQLRNNFAKGERALREIYGKDATKDEIIEEIIKEWEEAVNEAAKIPMDVKIGIAFQRLEKLIPELVGISTTWQTTEKTALFLIVTTALAKHYKVPDDKVEKLESVIERLIDVVPDKNQGMLGVQTRHYTRGLVLQFKNVYEEIKELDQDKKELMKISDEVQSSNANVETKEIDRFVSCVDDMRRRANKAFVKLFSSLTRRLEKTVAAVEKWHPHSDDSVRWKKIDNALGRSLTFITPNIQRVINTEMSRNCYLEFDVESLKDDYSLQLRKPKEN